MYCERPAPGDLLMDVPDYSWEKLLRFAGNRDAWRHLVNTIKGPRVHIEITPTDQHNYATILCTTAYKPTPQHNYETRARTAVIKSENQYNHSVRSLTITHPNSKTETIKYRDRDEYEMFFLKSKFKTRKK